MCGSYGRGGLCGGGSFWVWLSVCVCVLIVSVIG